MSPVPLSTPTFIAGLSSLLLLAGLPPSSALLDTLMPTYAPAAERLLERCAALVRLLAEDIMSARFAVVRARAPGAPFDAAAADDVLAPAPSAGRILCTTELGLARECRHDDGRTERAVLLRPKVLLDSVETLLP
jgi:hypothetical protein